jgi:hypothetical protein
MATKLTKFKLVNVDNIDRIVCRHGERDLDRIDDAFAEKLFNDGSAFVEKVEGSQERAKTEK